MIICDNSSDGGQRLLCCLCSFVLSCGLCVLFFRFDYTSIDTIYVTGMDVQGLSFPPAAPDNRSSAKRCHVRPFLLSLKTQGSDTTGHITMYL